LIAACRAIVIGGAGPADVATRIAALLAMAAIFVAIRSLSLRWQ